MGLSEDRWHAGFETCDTADWEICATMSLAFMAPRRVHSWRSKLSMNQSAEHRLGAFENLRQRAETVLGAPLARFKGSMREIFRGNLSRTGEYQNFRMLRTRHVSTGRLESRACISKVPPPYPPADCQSATRQTKLSALQVVAQTGSLLYRRLATCVRRFNW